MKIMAFDLDGTLLFDGVIASSTITAIHEWQAAGHPAVLCTGKSIAATKQALDPFDLRFDHYVLYTGAVITDRSYAVEESSTLSPDLVARFVDMLAAADTDINVYATTLDTPDALLVERVGSQTTNILINPHRMDPREIPQHTFVGIPIWIPGNEDLIQQTHRVIRTQFPEVDCHRNQDFLDIVPKGATKGRGLALLGELVDRPEVQTYSIGDSWNDLEMHRWADISASFPYSPPEVRAATTMVVGTAEEFIRNCW